jgi:hypothetical protein
MHMHNMQMLFLYVQYVLTTFLIHQLLFAKLCCADLHESASDRPRQHLEWVFLPAGGGQFVKVHGWRRTCTNLFQKLVEFDVFSAK